MQEQGGHAGEVGSIWGGVKYKAHRALGEPPASCAKAPSPALPVPFEFGPPAGASRVTLLEAVFISLLKLSHWQGREEQLQAWSSLWATKTIGSLLIQWSWAKERGRDTFSVNSSCLQEICYKYYESGSLLHLYG